MRLEGQIVQALEALQEGQKALQADVTAMKREVGQIPAIAQYLAQQEKQLDHHNTTLTQHGKLLNGIAATLGTVLEEQQAQRLDMRSLHTEVHASTEEVKAEMQAARAEAKRDTVDVKATVVKPLKDHAKRLDALEDAAGIPHPDNNERSSLRANETRNAPCSPSVDHTLFST
jgi:chromosome segregation ATPase